MKMFDFAINIIQKNFGKLKQDSKGLSRLSSNQETRTHSMGYRYKPLAFQEKVVLFFMDPGFMWKVKGKILLGGGVVWVLLRMTEMAFSSNWMSYGNHQAQSKQILETLGTADSLAENHKMGIMVKDIGRLLFT
jgi:hypothetical protein